MNSKKKITKDPGDGSNNKEPDEGKKMKIGGSDGISEPIGGD